MIIEDAFTVQLNYVIEEGSEDHVVYLVIIIERLLTFRWMREKNQ